jgi:DNA-binding MarR family transcriptional regulator
MAKPKPDDQIAQCTCLRLRKITRRVTQMYDQALAAADLTASQFGILAQLARRGDMSMGVMAEHLLMDPTSLTRTLRPLETRKLIKVVADKDDRRRRSIAITDAGREAFRTAVPHWRAVQAELADIMGDRAFGALDRSLDLSLQQLVGQQP